MWTSHAWSSQIHHKHFPQLQKRSKHRFPTSRGWSPQEGPRHPCQAVEHRARSAVKHWARLRRGAHRCRPRLKMARLLFCSLILNLPPILLLLPLISVSLPSPPPPASVLSHPIVLISFMSSNHIMAQPLNAGESCKWLIHLGGREKGAYRSSPARWRRRASP